MKNIPHVRRVGNPAMWLLDIATLRLASFFRLGPWFCVQCDQRELILNSRNRSVEDYNPTDSSEIESAGNYIRTSESLVIRRNRAARYSQKYRDSVVQRLISGTATISQMGQELNLSERDLVDWIADALENKQERIEQLTAILRSIQHPQTDQARIGNQKSDQKADHKADESKSYANDSIPTIDGEFQSR